MTKVSSLKRGEWKSEGMKKVCQQESSRYKYQLHLAQLRSKSYYFKITLGSTESKNLIQEIKS